MGIRSLNRKRPTAADEGPRTHPNMLYAASAMQPHHHPIHGLQPQPAAALRRPHPQPSPAASASALLAQAQTRAAGHNPHKRRQLIPSAHRPHPFARDFDVRKGSPPSSAAASSSSSSAALPGVSALLQPRPASAAGPRKRSLSGPTPADARMAQSTPQARHYPHVVSPTDRWTRADGRGSPASPRSVYMNLVDPSRHAGASATITPRGHPLHVHPQQLRDRDQHVSSALGPRPYGSFLSFGGRAPVYHRSASASAARPPPESAAFQFVDPASNRLMTRHPLAGPFGVGPPSAAGPMDGPAIPTTAGGGKPSRYLREMDRRVILARIDRGEKQSALAKEFQVSRAAICNLYKHRDEVMSRKDGNPLAKHPKKPRPKSAAAKGKSSAKPDALKAASAATAAAAGTGTAAKAPLAHELRSRAAALLLTTLRKKHTDAGAFRRSGARLMRLVLEEALALVPIKAVDIVLGSGDKADGVTLEHPPCAVAVSADADDRHPMLDVFADMEPEQPVGRVRFQTGGDDVGALEGDALPPTLGFHNVFLLELVAANPARACAAVRRLLERGAVESMVSLVALVVTQDVADALKAAFPAARVVTAQVEAAEDEPKAEAEAEADEQTSGCEAASSSSSSAVETFRRRLAQGCD